MNIFIPIKHNSQRVHRKNFRRFGKEPLFKHTLLKYKNHNVFVDTDSQEVIDLIGQDKRLRHVNVFSRSESLIGDKVSVCDLIKDFSDLKFQQDMGLLLGFMFIFNLLGAIFLAPVLLKLFGITEKSR